MLCQKDYVGCVYSIHKLVKRRITRALGKPFLSFNFCRLDLLRLLVSFAFILICNILIVRKYKREQDQTALQTELIKKLQIAEDTSEPITLQNIEVCFLRFVRSYNVD